MSEKMEGEEEECVAPLAWGGLRANIRSIVR